MITRWLSVCSLAVGVVAAPLGGRHARAAELERVEFTRPHMGVSVKLLFYSVDRPAAKRAADAAFQKIADLDVIFSDYNPDSELSRLSKTAGREERVQVSDPLWLVLTRAQCLARRSDGAFDVTVGPYVRLWRRARRSGLMPTERRLAKAREQVGHEHLILHADEQSVTLARPGMRLDLGGIAKGYIADEALRVLREHGFRRALVDAGGDLALGDPPPGETGWKVGVAALAPGEPPSRMLRLANCGVATSGDAFQYVEIGGRRYSHIVDPHTGLGLTRRSSITLIAPDCLTADGLASAVSVLGPKRGIELVDTTPDAAALVVVNTSRGIESVESRRMRSVMESAQQEPSTLKE